MGDVILKFNGTRLLKSSELPPLVGTAGVDVKARLQVLRDGRELDVKSVSDDCQTKTKLNQS